jgi:uncharacterized protein
MLRLANRHPRIAVAPEVMDGKPCIRGTRIPVDLILRDLGDGQSVEDILQAFPGVTREDVAFAVPNELLDAVVAHFDPVQVILFGSRARGEAGANSDIDLLVVLDDDVPAEKLGWRSAFEARRNFHRAVDIVPCRRRWFEDKRNVIGSLAHMAAADGVVVYERHCKARLTSTISGVAETTSPSARSCPISRPTFIYRGCEFNHSCMRRSDRQSAISSAISSPTPMTSTKPPGDMSDWLLPAAARKSSIPPA